MAEEQKTLDDLYTQRGEAFMLAMACAKLAGLEVGVREGGEWPVHVINLPNLGEVALHMKGSEAEPLVLAKTTQLQYDGHSDAEKSERIRAFVREVFLMPDSQSTDMASQ